MGRGVNKRISGSENKYTIQAVILKRLVTGILNTMAFLTKSSTFSITK